MILTEHRPARLPIKIACEALGLVRSTVYQSRKAKPYPRPARKKAQLPRALTFEERTAVLALLYSDEFADQPPREVYASLLDRGLYLCSYRTMYRLLKEQGASRERRSQQPRQKHAVPRLEARAPQEVWCWDISKLASEVKGVHYSLYLVMDLYSRYIVAWMISSKENSALACQLMETALTRYEIQPATLKIHQDRGSPMTAHRYVGLLEDFGVMCSHSRPRVSNDNAFSESQFKTMKYQPDYPKKFGSIEEARIWCAEYVKWYNEVHYHTELGLYTPEQVFTGQHVQIAQQRNEVLAAAYQRHPERFLAGLPKAAVPPAVVEINPLSREAIELGANEVVNVPGAANMLG